MKIELKHVVKKYDDFELDCCMEVLPGRVTGLIGRNGAGKSTTFKAILGLIHKDGGTVLADGKEVKEWSAAEKEKIGVVLSESGFSGYLTVSDVILVLKSMYPQFDEKDFKEKCRRFSIPLKKQIKEFSTGMKAKLKVLVALTHSAEVLILDEPTSGLDVIVREEILDMLHVYMQDERNSILISSHISSDLESLCDDIYLIDNGKIILHEETHVLLDEYGVLKVTEEQYQTLEKEYLYAVKRDKFSYNCLTDKKQFYLENYPEITIEKSSLDDIYSILLSGKEAM